MSIEWRSINLCAALRSAMYLTSGAALTATGVHSSNGVPRMKTNDLACGNIPVLQKPPATFIAIEIANSSE